VSGSLFACRPPLYPVSHGGVGRGTRGTPGANRARKRCFTSKYAKISKPVASNFNGLAVWPDAQIGLYFANVTMPDNWLALEWPEVFRRAIDQHRRHGREKGAGQAGPLRHLHPRTSAKMALYDYRHAYE
jgi:hypothetical protein